MIWIIFSIRSVLESTHISSKMNFQVHWAVGRVGFIGETCFIEKMSFLIMQPSAGFYITQL